MNESGGTNTFVLLVDLGPLPVCSRTDESFDDLIERKACSSEPLPRLKEFRARAHPSSVVSIVNGYRGKRDPDYDSRARRFIESAGFEAVNPCHEEGRTAYLASPRPPVAIEYDFGMNLREMITPDEVVACHEFAREIYYYRDFNYDYEVARQFDPNSDMFAVADSDGAILGIGRAILLLPGYACPFMYATGRDGARVEIAAGHEALCEVMGLYREGRQGIIAFKRLMSYLATYASEVARLESIWTTYDDLDDYTGTYYRRKLLMQDTGYKLVYRDFGGLWNLIMTDRIAELAQTKSKMFAT